MRRPPKRDPLDVFLDFLHAPCGVTREDFVVFNPKLFGRPRGATAKDTGH